MPEALRDTVAAVDCELLVLSYNDESWVGLDELQAMCAHHDAVVTLTFDSERYVGAKIGIHNPAGERVGKVSHLRNREWVLVAGTAPAVRRATAGTVTS